MKQKKEIPLYVASYNLLICIIKTEENIQKSIKYSVGQSIKEETIDLIKNIARANTVSDKKERHGWIEMAQSNIETIIILQRAVFELKSIPLKKYVELSEIIENISRQLSGWKKSSA
jgi:hypothetical protein